MRAHVRMPLAALLVSSLSPLAAQADGTPAAAGPLRLSVSTDGAPSKGATLPLVRVVVFTDFQCPFCARVGPTIERLLAAFPQDVRLYVRHNPLPFHPNAMPAAEAAVEALDQAGATAFWRMHDMLFANQQALHRAGLESYAREVGLDVSRFGRALDSERHRARIEADMAQAARIGASGTPMFFLNGRVLRGAQPYEAFETLVREEIALANAALTQGVRRDALYEHWMRGASTEPYVPPRVDRQAPPPPDDTVHAVPIPPDAPTRGPAGAPVTIQIFSDFQCPFCSRIRPTLDALFARYPGRIRLVWRHFPLPFHPNAMPAAEAAVEAYRQQGAAGFWRLHDLMFDHQQALDGEPLARLAARAGLNPAQFARALAEHSHRARVEADMTAVQRAGLRIGTPSCLINGRLLQGAQPLESFVSAVDRALGGPAPTR